MARFGYYSRLSAEDRRTYRKSDAIESVPLVSSEALQQAAHEVEAALPQGRRAAVQRAAAQLCNRVTRALKVAPVEVRVLARRPRSADGELHGLYTLESDGSAKIEVWMRTAEHERTVAPRTFLRTLLHELCHHLDFVLFDLAETFHTQGFFRRESSLVRLLCPKRQTAEPSVPSRDAPAVAARSVQLSLFD